MFNFISKYEEFNLLAFIPIIVNSENFYPKYTYLTLLSDLTYKSPLPPNGSMRLANARLTIMIFGVLSKFSQV